MIQAVLLYLLLRRATLTAVTDPDGQLPRNSDTFQLRSLDFASGTVVHISPNIFLAALPLAAWALVWIRDRAALRTRLGHTATWAALGYTTVSLAALLYMESVVTR